MPLLYWNTPVRYLGGVGEKRAVSLKKMGIETIGDLLYHFPRGYLDRGNIKNLSEAQTDVPGAYLLTVGSAPKSVMLRGRMTLTRFSAFDETRSCTVAFFNQAYVKDAFQVGETYRFWGKLKLKGGAFELNSPLFEKWSQEYPLPDYTAVYPLTAGVSQKFLAKIINSALVSMGDGGMPDILPEKVRSQNGLLPVMEAFRCMHCPKSEAEADAGRKRFAFEELYIFALGMRLSRTRSKRGTAPPMKSISIKPFTSKLDFSLTGAQNRVIADIMRDMTGDSRTPMLRMVAGDVGSGKTVCSAAAAYIAVKNGYQSALMAPTEILARQHYNDLSALFAGLDIKCSLLCGSMTAASKKKVREAIERGETDIVIGTHALLSQNVAFARPGLFITDEQHRFGVMQRAALSEKGNDCHVLVMSATPIPRTLSLIIFGDLDISRIDEMPPGRQKVNTFLVDESYRQRLSGFIRRQAQEGHQVYIVCPTIEDNEENGEEGQFVPVGGTTDLFSLSEPKIKLKNVVDYARQLSEDDFSDLSVGYIHGKLKSAEKEKIMAEFASGKIQILVSTTVIEVGVNVPNATLMIIENAERFGLSQLHQLRGRVGRGKAKSWCILVSETENPDTKERLQALCSSNDGYTIAQRDLEMRGPGDFLPTSAGGARQHGGIAFRLASLKSDMKLLGDAFSSAAQCLEDDPGLKKPENAYALSELNKAFDLSDTYVN